MNDLKVGDAVWFHDFSGIKSGKVIALMNKNSLRSKVACLECAEEFKSLDVDSRNLWMTRQEATLALAEKKQQEAATLLSSAADLFKRAGGMREDQVTGQGDG